MKITKQYLKQVIKEEMENVLQNKKPQFQKTANMINYSINDLDDSYRYNDLISDIYKPLNQLTIEDEEESKYFYNQVLPEIFEKLKVKISSLSESSPNFKKDAGKFLITLGKRFQTIESGKGLIQIGEILSGMEPGSHDKAEAERAKSMLSGH